MSVGIHLYKLCCMIKGVYQSLQMLHHLQRRRDTKEIWGCRHMVEVRHGEMTQHVWCVIRSTVIQCMCCVGV